MNRMLKGSPVWIAALLVACGGKMSTGAGGAGAGAGANMGDNYQQEIDDVARGPHQAAHGR